jgi:biopolymer transport protein ExbD
VNFYAKRRRKPEVIIVSLIDIFAILLIFMLITTQFKEEQPSVTIKLPESKTAVVAEKSPAKTVVLSIGEAEEIFLDAKPVEIDALKTAITDLMRQAPPPILALNADKKAPFGVVIRVLDVLKESGVKGNLSAFTEIKK